MHFEFYGSCKSLAKLFQSSTIWMPRSPVSKMSLLVALILSPYIVIRFFIKAWFLRKRNCLVYMHGLLEKIFFAPSLRYFNIPYVFVEHATIGDWLIKNPLFKVYKKNLKYKRSKLITVSKLMERDLKSLKPTVIPNAINRKFQSNKPKNSKRRILYVGRLTKDKGVHTILEASKNLPNYQFVFIGRGPLAHDIQNSQCKLYDNMSHRKIMDYFKKVDLLLLPSDKKDPFGLTVLEAMSQQVPALISEKVGILDYLKENENVFVFQNDLRTSIGEIFENPKSLNYVRSNLEQTYRTFGYKYMANTYFKIFQKL